MKMKYYVSFTGLGSSRVCDCRQFSSFLKAVAFGKSHAVPTSAGCAFVTVYLLDTNQIVADFLFDSKGWHRII